MMYHHFSYGEDSTYADWETQTAGVSGGGGGFPQAAGRPGSGVFGVLQSRSQGGPPEAGTDFRLDRERRPDVGYGSFPFQNGS